MLVFSVLVASASLAGGGAACCAGSALFGSPNAFPVGDGPEAVATADFDEDGNLDLLVANSRSDDVFLLRGVGDGTFMAASVVGAGNAPRWLTVADVNRDTVPDFIAVFANDNEVGLFLGLGDGSFSPKPPITVGNFPRAAAVGDFNGDGNPDLAVSNRNEDTVSVLLGAGDGTFTELLPRLTVGDAPLPLVAGHVNGDEALDIIVVNQGAADVSVLLGAGDGTFTEVLPRPAVGLVPFDAALGDVNNDSVADLLVANGTGNSVTVLLGVGDGSFAAQPDAPAGDQPRSIVIADVDGGALDLVTANADDGAVGVLLGVGDGTFAPPLLFPTGQSPRSVTLGDFNGDEALDVAAVNFNDMTVAVLINNGASATTTFWTGAAATPNKQFGDPANWQNGVVPSLGVPNVAAFDSSQAPFGPIESMFLSGDAAVGGFEHASEELRFDLQGARLTIAGAPQPPADPLGLELGVEQRGGEPFPAVAPQLRLDNSVTTASTLLAVSAIIGRDGPAGLEINGVNGTSRLEVQRNVIVGQAGEGSLRLRTVQSEFGYGDPGMTLIDVVVGGGADGIVDVTAGTAEALAVIRSMTLGRDPGSTGTIRIAGLDSAWTHSSDELTVGDGGRGVVEITGGATFSTDVTAGVTLARQPGSSADVRIAGVGSSWVDPSAVISVGGSGTATLAVEDGGELNVLTVTNTATGELRGDGAVVGDVVNFGDAAPGLPSGGIAGAGVLAIDGDYDQFDDPENPALSGRLLLGLHESAGAAAADRLDITGEAALAGSLIVGLAPGFDPSTDPDSLDGLPLLNAGGGILGRFDAALFPALGAQDRFLRAQIDPAGSVTLIVGTLDGDVNVGEPNAFSVNGAPKGATLADCDGDGLLDLAVVVPDDVNPGTAPGDLIILENAGSIGGVWQGFTGGTTQIPVGVNPVDVAAADLDNQNGVDFVVANREDGTVSVLLNDGTGAMTVDQTLPVNTLPTAITTVDFDQQLGQGPDIAVTGEDANGGGIVTVRLNNGVSAAWDGLGAAQDFAVGSSPIFMDSGDLDNDKDLDQDLLVANFQSGTVSALTNQGVSGGVWQGLGARVDLPVPQGPVWMDAGDLDNDKDLDFLVTSAATGQMSAVLNQGAGSFAPSADLPVGSSALSVALADLDQDGDLDAAVVVDDADTGERLVRILRNDLTADGLAFAPAQDIATGAQPVLVLAENVDNQSGADIVAVNEQTGSTGGALSPEGEPIDNDVTVALTTLTPPCPADLNNDLIADGADLGLLLLAWDPAGPVASPADLNGDDTVDGADLGLLLLGWGACP